ncbi:MAG: cellulase family glycosylhydrolase, partial [Frankiales bacterium]|nr:cellulase family glycosylhydrolase [Frankiales bacterium]
HAAPGALRITGTGAGSGARSPAFAVTPGDRYVGSAWVRAASGGHRVAAGLVFFDSTGAAIASAAQRGEPVTDNTAGWVATWPVAAVAPPQASSAAMTVVSADSTSGVDEVDDVTMTEASAGPAALVPPLTTSGTTVLDGLGRAVHLHGVQLGGMADRQWTPGTVSTEEIGVVHSWGANFVRLPLLENAVVPGDCLYDAGYLAEVDRIVHDVTSLGMLVSVDLHLSAVTPCGSYGKQDLPDSKGVRFWQIVAARYRSNPLVAFDLFNEPHNVTDVLWRDGGVVTSGGMRYAGIGMQRLYDTVRATGATNLVFVSGTRWATTAPTTSLSGTTNTVWGVHAYTCPTKTAAQGGKCTPGPAGPTDPTGILSRWVGVHDAPVMVTEFGYPDPSLEDYIAHTDAFARSHGWVGWNAFVMDGGKTSAFRLVRDTSPTWNPEASGMAVLAGMLDD